MTLTYSADQLRRYDYDHYLITLFAQARYRDALFSIFSFNYEINKIHEGAEPQISLIRLQWWRDKIDELYGEKKISNFDHPLLEGLCLAIDQYQIPKTLIEACFDDCEREFDFKQPETQKVLANYFANRHLALWLLIEYILGKDVENTMPLLRQVVCFSETVNSLRCFSSNLQKCHLYFPLNMMEKHGLTRNKIEIGQAEDGINNITQELVSFANEVLENIGDQRKLKQILGMPIYIKTMISRQYLQIIINSDYNLFSSQVQLRPKMQVLRLYFKSLF